MALKLGFFFGTPWSNKSDAQPPERDNMKFVLICLNRTNTINKLMLVWFFAAFYHTKQGRREPWAKK
jgi:hypothetical protein